MDLQQLQLFLSVVDNGSFSAAASAGRLSQPALTKSMKRLEDELGVRLFHRLPRGVAPTVFGEALARHFRSMQVEMRHAIAELSALSGCTQGHVAVGAGNTWMTGYLPQAVARLLRVHPGLKFDVISESIEKLVERLNLGELDLVLGVIAEEYTRGDLCAETLLRNDSVVMAREGHGLVRRRRVSFTDLLAADWVLPPEDSPGRVQLNAMFHRNGFPPPQPVITTNSVQFLYLVARQTDLLSFAPENRLGHGEGQGLMRVGLPQAAWPRDSGIIYRRRHTHSPAARLLIDELRFLCGQPFTGTHRPPA
jgi:DNA-binding transcriptional LysR family regulator